MQYDVMYFETQAITELEGKTEFLSMPVEMIQNYLFPGYTTLKKKKLINKHRRQVLTYPLSNMVLCRLPL